MSRPRVLAVDDDPINLDIIGASLEGADLDLTFADGGPSAVGVLEDCSNTFDLVILDRMMPAMDGLQVLRWIKSTPRLSPTPVIMQTAAASPEQVEEGLRAGAHYYLTKPYAPGSLRTIVNAALEDGQRGRALETRLRAKSDAVLLARSASFRFRTLDQGLELAALLSTFCPDPGGVVVGLTELLCNAVEHGNLELTYQDKAQLKRSGGWAEELVSRERLPKYRERYVDVSFERRADTICFKIVDQGAGFDWKPYLTLEPTRAYDPNGRGIALARLLSFQDLYYEDGGRTAVAIVAVPTAAADA